MDNYQLSLSTNFYKVNLSQYTKEFSYNIKLAYPVILGMLGHTLIGIVDN